MTNLNNLINYIEQRLATADLELSQYGKDEVVKRFNKSEANGGYSDYWKDATTWKHTESH